MRAWTPTHPSLNVSPLVAGQSDQNEGVPEWLLCSLDEKQRWCACASAMAQHGRSPSTTRATPVQHFPCWNHIAEITRQLRGECGARQVQPAEVLQWVTCFDDSSIFRR
jgi:hypothetical protein